jgi:hypothetical protein
VHLGDPVAQRIHDHLQYVRMTRIEAIPACAEVHVVPRVVLAQPVVRGVVDSAIAERRAEMVSFGRVVVHHVDEDLDTGRVQRFHHRFEFVYLPILFSSGGIAVVRSEVADGVKTPVVRQAPADQPVLVHELVNRHKLDRGDAEALQVADHGRVG